MKIINLLNNDRCTLSFEVFPPKVSSSFDEVKPAIEKIAQLKPSFMSVTYGAGGGTSRFTLDIAEDIRNRYSVPTMAHLTCVSSTRETVLEKKFTVTNKSEMKIKDEDVPKKIKQGKSYTVAGKIYSNYALKSVTAKVVDEDGKAVFGSTARMANLYFYNLQNMDKDLKFSELEKGKYHYVVTATNKKGKETLVDKEFTVK